MFRLSFILKVALLFSVVGFPLGNSISAQDQNTARLTQQTPVSIRTILNQREISFDEKVEMAESFFAKKYPGLSPAELSSGEYRDGDFVKYQRWKSFWEIRLDNKGQMADIVGYKQKAIEQSKQQRSSSPLSSVVWDNSLSHTDYIISQIGMGRTTAMAFHPTDPNTFYVGAAIGGIWKTTDGGNTYTPIGDNLPHLSIGSILLDPNNPSTIYAAVSDNVWYGHYGIGVYVSHDDGASWSPTAFNYPLSDLVRIYQLAMDPNDPMTMMAASDLGLHKTTDGWATYSTVATLPCHDIHYLEGNSNILVAGGLEGEILRSSNGGANFNFITDLGGFYARIATTPLDPNKIVVTVGSNIYASSGGTFFTQIGTMPENNMVVAISPMDANTIMTGNFEVFLSTNNGGTFTQIADWLGDGAQEVHVDQRNLFVNPLEPQYIYIANDGGIYRYNLNTGIFDNLSDGLIITQYYDIAVAQTDVNVISGGSQDNGSLYRTSGGTWVEHAPTGDGFVTEIDPTDANIIYWEFQFGSLSRTDVGSGSVNISPPGQGGTGSFETPYKLDPKNPARLVIGYDRVFETLDRGSTWAEISPSLAGGRDLNEINIAKSNPERIYATQGNFVYVKNTFDDNWVTRQVPAQFMITDIEIDPCDEDIVYVSAGGYAAGNKVFKSTNAGATWQNISDNLPNVLAASIEMYEPAIDGIFVGTDVGVFYRDNTFSNWQELGMLPHTTVDDIEIQCKYDLIRVGTYGRSIWEADLSCLSKTAPDEDSDGVIDCCDFCPFFDDKLIGLPCDDGNPVTVGEVWRSDCSCSVLYCDAEGASGTSSDWIARVELENLDNTSVQTSYSDFTSLSASLDENASYPITVTLNAAFSLDAVYVWIDFNGDMVFDNNTELISMSALNGNVTSTGTVNVPCVPTSYSTRMRVRVIFADPNVPEPCGSLFGEVEDYTIEINNINTCYDIQISR